MYYQRFKTPEQRFKERYHVAECGCWLWNTGNGIEYPKFWVDGRYVRASHYAYGLVHGDIGPNPYICHSCDNPRCVNPEHLFLGDHHANMADKVAKNRSYRGIGEKNGRATITRALAEHIRFMYTKGLSQQTIADRMGLSQASVSSIIRNQTWRNPSEAG